MVGKIEMVGPSAGMVRRARLAAIVGTSLAFCDFFLYATAIMLVVAPTLAATGPPSARWLITASPFVGFAARPVGGLVFSSMGDRVGRKSTLVATLLLMGVATVAIGFVPLKAGLLTAASLAVLRFVQGVGLGGEWA